MADARAVTAASHCLLRRRPLSDQARRRGNTEGTQTRARPGAPVQASSAVSFFLRGFRGRPAPRLPAFPAPDFDGKEGVDGSSPSEGFLVFAGGLETSRKHCGGGECPIAA